MKITYLFSVRYFLYELYHHTKSVYKHTYILVPCINDVSLSTMYAIYVDIVRDETFRIQRDLLMYTKIRTFPEHLLKLLSIKCDDKHIVYLNTNYYTDTKNITLNDVNIYVSRQDKIKNLISRIESL